MPRYAVAFSCLIFLALAACGEESRVRLDDPAPPRLDVESPVGEAPPEVTPEPPPTQAVEQIPNAEIPAWAEVSIAQAAAARKHSLPAAFENDLGMRFVLIPAGTFRMGTSESEKARVLKTMAGSDKVVLGWEGPQREVRISKPFYMQIHETTFGQYRAWRPNFAGSTFFGHPDGADNRPVQYLSHEVVAGPDGDGSGPCFVAWLNGRPANRGAQYRKYRLPTEAEWEYACRAGTDTAFYWGAGVDEAHLYANGNDPLTKRVFEWTWAGFQEDDGHRITAPVGSFLPNAWGLHDMLGNVHEWVSDWFAPNYGEGTAATDPQGPESGGRRVVRGGSFYNQPWMLRCAQRHGRPPSGRLYDRIGFRLVCEVPSAAPGK